MSAEVPSPASGTTVDTAPRGLQVPLSVPVVSSLLAALVLWLFRDAVFAGGVLYKRDIHLVWHPQIEALARAIAAGTSPLWDPGPAFGQPLLADPAAQALYPLTWLSLLIRPWWYYSIFAMVHVLGSALSLNALCRHWKISRGGSLVAAVVWMLCGPYLSLIDLWHHFAGASWIPLVTLAAEVALTSRQARHALYLGLALGGQALAGSADMCAMTLLLLLGLALSRHVRWSGSGLGNRAVFACAAIAGSVGIGLSAGLWLPALDLLSRSARASLPLAVRTYWSVHPLGLLDTLIPGLWSSLPLRSDWRTLLFESREPFLSSIYLGLPVLALVGAAAAAAKHPLRRRLLALLVIALVLALGRHTPAYDLALIVLPPLKILRYPVKVLILAAFAWAILAGMGYDVWREPSSPRAGPWRLLVVAPLATILLFELGLLLITHTQPDVWAARLLDPASAPSRPALLEAVEIKLAVGVILSAALLSLALVPRRLPGLAVGLALLAGGELAFYHRHAIPVAPVGLYTHRPEVLNVLRPPSEVRVYAYDYSIGRNGGPDLEFSELRALERIPAGWTFDAASALGMQMALAPQTAGRWSLRSGFEIDYRGLHPEPVALLTLLLRRLEGTPGHVRLLRLGAITHVVASHREAFQDLIPLAEFPGLFRGPILVFSVPAPLPRTYVVGGKRVAGGADALSVLLDESFDLSREVLLEEGSPAPPRASFIGESRILQEVPDRVLIEADLNEPGFVVLVDSYDPGWRASLDGREVPIRRANTAFRAVEVPAGHHTLEYVYRPRAAIFGILLSGLTLGSALVALARSRRQGPTPPARTVPELVKRDG